MSRALIPDGTSRGGQVTLWQIYGGGSYYSTVGGVGNGGIFPLRHALFASTRDLIEPCAML